MTDDTRRAYRVEDLPPEWIKALACPKCGGWGVSQIETYEILPCPECGIGKPSTVK